VLDDVLAQARDMAGVFQGDGAPVEGRDVDRAGHLVRPELPLQLKLCPKGLLRTLVLDDEDAQGPRYGKAEPIDAACEVERGVDRECRLTLAAAGEEDEEPGRGQERFSLVSDERGRRLARLGNELLERKRERLLLYFACGSNDSDELVAAAGPVAQVAALDGWPHSHGLAAEHASGLRGASVAGLVSVVAEVDDSAARDEIGPAALQRLRAGRDDHDRGAWRCKIEQARTVRFAFCDKPVRRVEFPEDDRPQPRRARFRARLGR